VVVVGGVGGVGGGVGGVGGVGGGIKENTISRKHFFYFLFRSF